MKKSVKKKDSDIHNTHNFHTVTSRIINTSNKKPKRKNIEYGRYLSGQAYDNFIGEINNVVTKEKYNYWLYMLCEKLDITTEELYKYSNEFGSEKKDPSELERRMKRFINEFKQPLQEYDPRWGIIHMQFYAFKSFCESNRIVLDFAWLKKSLPKKAKKGKDKAYTKDEIITMLAKTDERSRLIILLLATTGMRESALCGLRKRDISAKMNSKDELEGAEIIIYKNDNEEDKIYCTPECYNAYLSYLNTRRELGENITAQSPVILRRIPPNKLTGWEETRTISRTTISAILTNVARDAGLRKLLSDSYKQNTRYINKITVGFRKFAETTMMGARSEKDGTRKMNPYIADRLLSHTRRGGLPMTENYDQSEVFEDYKHVISELTFSKEAEYKAKYEQAEVKLQSLEQVERYINQKEKEFTDLKQKVYGMSSLGYEEDLSHLSDEGRREHEQKRKKQEQINKAWIGRLNKKAIKLQPKTN